MLYCVVTGMCNEVIFMFFLKNKARYEKNSRYEKVVILVAQCETNTKIAKKSVAHIFSVKNIGYSAFRDATGHDNFDIVRVKLALYDLE